MRLKEYQGKQLFNKYGILIPHGELITSIKPNSDKIAKAQVLEGKRGKRGLIKPATKENLTALFEHCKEILVEEKLTIEKEYYLALTIDKTEKEIVILFSESGGIDVEDSKNIQNLAYSNINKFQNKEIIQIIRAMHKLMIEYNALLVEINPLVLSNGKLIAADSKIILDDNIMHPDFKQDKTILELEAERSGLSYVELDGNIGLIGNGAGLVMATLDVISHFGGKVANFLDLGGGAAVNKMQKALEIVAKTKPKVIFINIFGGITRCDDIARGIVNQKLSIPLVIRMIGTSEEKAKEILDKNNIKSYDSMEDCARIAVKDANK